MTQETAMKIIDILDKQFPNARLILNYRNAFELLVVTILAAQAPDERVN
ncbi:MAG: endonuclease III, partial [Candidatus Atribacteria bacterium]|nr:endonuclease III [Candidatus Atribacteria bacterium]